MGDGCRACRRSRALDAVTVRGRKLTANQKGEARQYSKNVSNAYLGKEYLERYHTDSAGDILKGLNGVYSMNTRTAGSSVTPNIRGLSGKGRIPVTIDGMEQTVDVWQNNYGISDRNYVDPALFRSISVEKGPAMTRGVKSGVGGSVAISTIEPEDIVETGKHGASSLKAIFPTAPSNSQRACSNTKTGPTTAPSPTAPPPTARSARSATRRPTPAKTAIGITASISPTSTALPVSAITS